MNTPQTPEQLTGNKLIADFMGLRIGVELYSWRPGCTQPLEEKHLNYHESWGWLMPVIEKISLHPLIGAEDYGDTCHPITFNMPTEDGKRMFRFRGYAVHEADTIIEAAWMAVVEFVEHQKYLEEQSKTNL